MIWILIALAIVLGVAWRARRWLREFEEELTAYDERMIDE